MAQAFLQDKRAARAEARARLRALGPDALRAAGQAIAVRLFARPEWRQAGAVFCFVSLPSEPDTTPILRRALAEGKRLYVPRMLGGGRMELVEICSLDSLRPNAFGIREPAAGPVLEPDAPGPDMLAIVPCLAASKDGVRLGRGGGYYDRFLAGFPGRALLACPGRLVFDALPADSWDVRFATGDILTD
ncbi:MAG TPA: 5-formyltetrahydrofolate cyclo-ligase [Candidatus Gemmiger faecigallinarum]|nr:5-formyltetrahydrofolate cyclo-ligase [Candidatus Gemmiger faecigallinarum]